MFKQLFEKTLDFSFFMDYNVTVINYWEDIYGKKS